MILCTNYTGGTHLLTTRKAVRCSFPNCHDSFRRKTIESFRVATTTHLNNHENEFRTFSQDQQQALMNQFPIPKTSKENDAWKKFKKGLSRVMLDEYKKENPVEAVKCDVDGCSDNLSQKTHQQVFMHLMMKYPDLVNPDIEEIISPVNQANVQLLGLIDLDTRPATKEISKGMPFFTEEGQQHYQELKEKLKQALENVQIENPDYPPELLAVTVPLSEVSETRMQPLNMCDTWKPEEGSGQKFDPIRDDSHGRRLDLVTGTFK